ncbi:HD-GYP domain-containing protein [Sporosarcina sp. CAU 1771]
MEETFVKVSNLRPGIVITEDIYVNTNQPIIRRNTKIAMEHLKVLEAFSVREVKVEKGAVVKRDEALVTDDMEPIDPDNLLAEITLEQIDVLALFDEVVQQYKREFNGWRAGVRVNVAKIRTIIMPLLEVFIEKKEYLLNLTGFSDSKQYIYQHPIAVGVISAAIGNQMGLLKGQVLQLGLAGIFADCGMAKVDTSIYEKVAFLTKEEFNEVKKHTVFSYQMIQDTPLLRQEMKLAIFQHHERLDGSGYPRGDKMEEVSIYSQIIAVADVFHAMTSQRLYQSKESAFKVIELIKEEEFGKFDIKVVQALEDLLGNLSIGTKVRLTNGDEGEILFIHRDAKLRPMIRLDTDGTVFDLTKNRSVSINQILS